MQAPPTRHPMDTHGGPVGFLFGTLDMLLGDSAPVIDGKPLAHFYIGVREIDAIADGQSVTLGVAQTPYQMDLLQYQNGSTDWMTQTDVAAQTYSQLRFVIDAASTQAVFTDGTSAPVAIDSGSSQSSVGLGSSTATAPDQSNPGAVDVTVTTPFTVQSGADALAGDFNLMESLNAGSGALSLRPTIALANGAGQINGTVLNQNGSAVQNATVVAFGSNGSAVNTTATDANGAFNLHALPADTYQLVIYNTYTNAAGETISASGQSSGGGTVNGPSVSLSAGGNVSTGTIGD